jgi:hypothetical protein
MKPQQPSTPIDSARRRAFGRGAGWAGAAAAGFAPLPARAASRFDSRARFTLAGDFAGPPDAEVLVPWSAVRFQSGSDVALQADGKVLVRTHGLYECVISADWQLKTALDYDLRQIGLRLQRQGQPDEPVSAHERIGFLNTPGSDPPCMARAQVDWGPLDIPLGATVGIEVPVTPAGTLRPGDMAIASHGKLNLDAMPAEALRALLVHAKVVAEDLVGVSLHNPSIAEGIHVRQGLLKVLGMTAQAARGQSGDAWQIIHTASMELFPGDRVYGVLRHKVAGSVLQATYSSYLQIDRLA